MFDRIYIERDALPHPRVRALLKRYPLAERITCERYGEIFNPKRQNFRLQKLNPSLIIALKRGKLVLPTPPDYGLGANHHFYFSHMLNCLYDCRYCFLQGLYRSAHYTLFLNFEDFQAEIDETLDRHPHQTCFFFSGYDCDSLAMDKVTGFLDAFLPFFEKRPKAWLELRTKSVQVAPLLKREPIANIITAFSLNPEAIVKKLELKTPSLEMRLRALRRLAEAGWKVGLRFDPLVHFENGLDAYERLVDQVFGQVPIESIHSITLGTFRSPKSVFKQMESLFPEEPLFMGNFALKEGTVSYRSEIESELIERIGRRILEYASPSQFFPCQPIPSLS